MKRIIFVLLIVLAGKCSLAQFNFYFLPEVSGRSVDGLGMFQIQNLTGRTLQGQVVIVVKENTRKQHVVTITTPVTNLGTGTYNFPKNVFAGSVFKFSNGPFSSIVNQTKSFPPGEYTFCYQFVNANKLSGDEYENCFDAEILPLVPITLLNPADRDKICQTRPVLSWQPPIPFHPSMRFRLLLTEKRQGESVENLLINAPLVLLDNITSTTINYPASRPELKEGKTYCWQVLAYQQNIVMSKSEIWEFTIECKEPSKQLPNDSYRELKSLVNGNYYIANRAISFSFNNNYAPRKLSYTVIDMSEREHKISNLPEITLAPGLNKIDIDLTDSELMPGRQYLLKVYPFNEPAIEVRFIYQDKEITQ